MGGGRAKVRCDADKAGGAAKATQRMREARGRWAEGKTMGCGGGGGGAGNLNNQGVFLLNREPPEKDGASQTSRIFDREPPEK